MAESGKVLTQSYDIGDFIHWLVNGTRDSIGVVIEKEKDKIRLRHFEGGLPFDLYKYPQYSSLRKASKDKALAYFHGISERFEKEVEDGGLSGAVYARRQHYLDGVISKLEEKESDSFASVVLSPEDPMTGTYVLMGIYSGQGPSDHLDALTVEPRLSESTVAHIIIDTHPEGFGNIPFEVYNTPATSHGSLVGYNAYEVPEKALHLVEDPRKLELKFFI